MAWSVCCRVLPWHLRFLKMNPQRHAVLLLCLGLGIGSPAVADDLGRLFTTPAERTRIDAVRAGRVPIADAELPARAEASDHLMVNGSVVGSDGKRLVWLNGVRTGPDDPAHLQQDGRVRLDWHDGVRLLKPGQVLDRTSGEIFEGYARPQDRGPDRDPDSAPTSTNAPTDAPAPPPTDAATGSVTAPGSPGTPDGHG